MDYKKEIAKPKACFSMLSACCVSTDSDMYGCIEKSVAKDGFCIIMYKEHLRDCFYQRWCAHNYISDTERFDLYYCSNGALQLKDIWSVCKAE